MWCGFPFDLQANQTIVLFSKVGGLDSRDQSRSRSRFLDTSRLTFESVEIYLDGRDQLLKVSRSRVSIEISTKIEILGHKPCRDFVFWSVFQTVEKISTVETSSLPVLRSRVLIETRSRQIETPKPRNFQNRNKKLSDLSDSSNLPISNIFDVC